METHWFTALIHGLGSNLIWGLAFVPPTLLGFTWIVARHGGSAKLGGLELRFTDQNKRLKRRDGEQ